MKSSEKLEQWLETLNDVSGFLDNYITCEEDKNLTIKLDKVIDDIYNIMTTLQKMEK